MATVVAAGAGVAALLLVAPLGGLATPLLLLLLLLLVLLVLPGSFVLLPLIAAGREWSRNRGPRPAGEAGPGAADA